MKIISYVGAEGDNIVIQRKEDLYPLLDWFQSRLLDLGDEESADIVQDFMQLAEKKGFGSYDEIDKVEY